MQPSFLCYLYFQKEDCKELQKSEEMYVGCSLWIPQPLHRSSQLVICGSMNFDHESEQFNNMKYSMSK